MGCASSTPKRPLTTQDGAPGSMNNAQPAASTDNTTAAAVKDQQLHTNNNPLPTSDGNSSRAKGGASSGTAANGTDTNGTSSSRGSVAFITAHILLFIHPTEDQQQQLQNRRESFDDNILTSPSSLSPSGIAAMKIGLDKMLSNQMQALEYFPNDNTQCLIRFIPLGSKVQTNHGFELLKRLVTVTTNSSNQIIRVVACGDDSTAKFVMNKMIHYKIQRIDQIPIAMIPLTNGMSQFQQISSWCNWGTNLPSPLLGESMGTLLSRLAVIALYGACKPSMVDAWNIRFVQKSSTGEENEIDNQTVATFVTQLTLESVSTAILSQSAPIDKYIDSIRCGREKIRISLENFRSLIFQNAPSPSLWPDTNDPSSEQGEFRKQDFGDEILELSAMTTQYHSISSAINTIQTSGKAIPCCQKLFFTIDLNPEHANLQCFIDGCLFQPNHSYNCIEIERLSTFSLLRAPQDVQSMITSNEFIKPLSKNPTQRTKDGQVLTRKTPFGEEQIEDPFMEIDDFDRPDGTRPPRTMVFFVNPSSGGNLASAYTKIQVPTIRFTSTSSSPTTLQGALHELRHAVTLHIVNLTSTYEREKGIRAIMSAHYPYAIACGGDGTVRWLLSLLADSVRRIPVGVIPFGTGNDMARVLGWGGTAPSKLTGHGLEAIRIAVEDFLTAHQKDLDVWGIDVALRGGGLGKLVKVEKATEVESTPLGAGHSKSAVLHEMLTMINYFSCGADAEMVFEFEKRRKQSQAANIVEYARQGAIQTFITPHYVNVFTKTVLDANGDPIKLDLSSSRILLFPNIYSYGGGQDLWGDRVQQGLQDSQRASRTDSGAIPVISQTYVDEGKDQTGNGAGDTNGNNLGSGSGSNNGGDEVSVIPASQKKRQRRASISSNFLQQDFGDGILEMMAIRATNSVGIKIATAGVMNLGIKRIFQSSGYTLEFIPGTVFYIQVDGEALRCIDADRITVFRQPKKALMLMRAASTTSKRATRFSLTPNAPIDSARGKSDSVGTTGTPVPSSDDESRLARVELLALVRNLRMELDRVREERDKYKNQLEMYQKGVSFGSDSNAFVSASSMGNSDQPIINAKSSDFLKPSELSLAEAREEDEEENEDDDNINREESKDAGNVSLEKEKDQGRKEYELKEVNGEIIL